MDKHIVYHVQRDRLTIKKDNNFALNAHKENSKINQGKLNAKNVIHIHIQMK